MLITLCCTTQKTELGLQAQNEKTMTKGMIFRLTITDWKTGQVVKYEGNLATVLDHLERASTTVYTVSEINDAVNNQFTLQVTSKSTATIEKI